MERPIFILSILILIAFNLFSQNKVAIKAQNRFEKYIQRHENTILPKVKEQLPLPIDSCNVYYIFEINDYRRNDSIFLEDYQYPRFLKIHKPVKGFNNNWRLAHIETMVFSHATKRHFRLGGEKGCCNLNEANWSSPDTVMMNYMAQNNIQYCIKYELIKCCVLNNNNLWVSDGKKMVPLGELLTKNWIKFSYPINERAFLQHKANQ